MTTIRISDRTALDDVVAWALADCDSLRISKRSSFEAGAQGLALARLASVDLTRSSPSLECDFEEPISADEVNGTLFAGGFGFAISRLARRISFAGQPASARFKPLLSAVYKQHGGLLGSGTTRSLICADPIFALPPALAQSGAIPTADSFPAPSAFAMLLTSMVKEMGFRRLLASAEELGLVSFLYEALRNSWEHGLSSNPSRRGRSTRALIIEKVVIQRNDIAGRRLSPELKAYLERLSEANDRLGLGVVCFTVADQGDGIQSTLPSRPGEAPEARLARAFTPGESRKPAGVVSRGLGLPNVVAAAHRLQALIRITSGRLSIGQDFSTGEHKYPQLDFGSIQSLEPEFDCGTCISIFVPEYSFDLDQTRLFGR